MGIVKVAPHAGAWIEIQMIEEELDKSLSLPTRERGLKFVLVGVLQSLLRRRSPRGSVD